MVAQRETLAVALRSKSVKESYSLFPVSVGANLPPVKEIGQGEEGEQGIARRHTLDKARLIWYLQVKCYACIDKRIDIGGEQRDQTPDDEPEARIGPAIGQQGDHPHEVLCAEDFAGHD